MARYAATTKLTPAKIIARATEHFGALSGGMVVKSKTDDSLCLESPDGYVTLSICSGKGKKNELEIETSQFDSQVREFLKIL